VDEIVAKLTPVELEQVIKIVGRCPRCYPPGAYDALKGHRRTPSLKPQPGINPGPERSDRSAEQTKPATQHTQRWTPPRRFAGFGAKVPLSASQHGTGNRYGITLNHTWTEWAAKQGVSETIAAALYLISENRKTDEVMVKLTPSEIERVIEIVQRWPDCFPSGALAALNHSRPAPPREQSAAFPARGAGHRPAARINPGIGQLHPNAPALPRAAVHSAPERTTAQKASTRPGTRAETARRRLVVADLMKAGLSIRNIATGTGIPVTSVHRAMRAIARAQAKQEAAVLGIMEGLLNKGLRRKRAQAKQEAAVLGIMEGLLNKGLRRKPKGHG
jgi:hypothetical protein